MHLKRLLILAAVGLAIILVMVFELHQFLTLAALKEQHSNLQSYIAQNMTISVLTYMGIYIVATALSIPGAIVLTLAGGALFGLVWGTAMVSVSSTLGATLAFLIARVFFGETVRNKFSSRFTKVNQGFEEDGAYFLFSLRLIPVIPFFLINILMAITPIKWSVFLLVSMLGMFPATVVFVNAGTELASIKQVNDILSPGLILAFIMIALLPWAARIIVKFSKRLQS